ncbi:hypothetical protein FRC08_001308 [Ceratobasidium sp. 394]|nr:hypothetical protein FRC08_001308 [Ceratobasidium sp. 394]
MEALIQCLSAQSTLKRAASDFLDACTTLRALALQSLPSCYSQDALETALDEVQSHLNTINLVEDQLKASRTALHLLLNTSTTRVPINRLPSELFSSIFTMASDPINCHNDYYIPLDYLVDVRLVCARWNRIITNTPSLWSHIDTNLDPCSETSLILDSVRLRLHRSRGVPIHLHFWGSSKIPEDNVSELVSILQPHLTRLKWLTICGTRASRLIHSLFELHSSPGWPGTLKSLCCVGIEERHEEFPIPWTSLSGLVELDLLKLAKYTSPLLSELVGLLSNCPTLHTLRLRYLGVRASPGQEYPAIHLPFLRLLELVLFDCHDETLHLLPLLVPGVLELDVRLDLRDIDSSHLASHIRPLLERSNVTFLSFQKYRWKYSTDLKSLLASVPRLRALLLQHACSNSLELIGELLSSIKDGSAQPFPDLQCLCLVSCIIDSEVMDRIGRVVTGRSLRSLVFWSCSIRVREASHSDEGEDEDEDEDGGEDEDEEVEVRDRWSQDLENVRRRISGQVGRIIVVPLPRSQIRDGIDLSIQELVNV